MIKAVVDTNVIVSGFISPLSYPREIERGWRRGEFILATSNEITEEINHVLRLPRIQSKYNLTESDIQSFILSLVYVANNVAGKLILEGAAPDPGDDKIISCAVESREIL